MEIYSRFKNTKENTFDRTDEAGNTTTVTVNQDNFKVILVGTVDKVFNATTTKNGHKQIGIKLSDVTSFNDTFGIEETIPGEIINFYDNRFANSASDVEKLKIKEGSVIMVKAVKSVSQDDEGRVNYIGSRVKYPGSTPMQYRDDANGKGCYAVLGYTAVPADATKGLSVNAKAYKDDPGYWIHLTSDGTSVDESVRNMFVYDKAAGGKAKIGAFVISPENYHETLNAENKVTDVSATFDSAYVI